MGGLIRVYAGGSTQWKKLFSCSFKNMLDFHVHPQITLCGKNVSSEMDGEREGWLQITI